MKKLIVTLLGVAVLFSFENCNDSPTEPDTELPTYTWKGTLYKGMGEEVWANATIELEAIERELAGYNYISVASGTSDENGRFELTYEQLPDVVPWETRSGSKNKCESIVLLVNGREVLGAPCDIDLERDIAEVDHHKFICDISELKTKGIDSLFILVPEMVHTQGTSSFEGYRIKKLTITDSTSDEITVYSGLTSYWDNSPIDYIDLWYGFTKQDFSLAVENGEHNLIDINSKGFPFTNHVRIPVE